MKIWKNKRRVCVWAVMSVSAILGSHVIAVRAAWGDVDTTFGTSGSYLDSTSAGHYPAAMAIQPDGRILVTGYYTTVVGGQTRKRIFLRRYMADGGRDVTFGSNGVATASDLIAVNGDYLGRELVVLPNGNIVVLAEANGTLAVRTYYAAGSLKQTRTLSNFPLAEAHIAAIGSVVYASIYRQGFVWLTRLSVDGSQDMTFNGTGWVATALGGYEGHALIAEADVAKLTLAGSRTMQYVTVDRFFADGSSDPSLGSHADTDSQSEPVAVQRLTRQLSGTYVVSYARTGWASAPAVNYISRFDTAGRFLGRQMSYPVTPFPIAPVFFLGVQQNDYVVLAEGWGIERYDPSFATRQIFQAGPLGVSSAALSGGDKLVMVNSDTYDPKLIFTRYQAN